MKCTCPEDGRVIINSCPVHGGPFKITLGVNYRCPKCGYEQRSYGNMDTLRVDSEGQVLAATGYLCPVCTIEYLNSLGLPVMQKVDES